VDQVSKPVLIALVAAVALIGAKFTVLRSNDGGGSSAPAAATAPGQAGLQSAIDKANNAVGVSKQSATRSEQAAAAASGDASGGTAAPAAKASKHAVTKVAKAAPAKPAPVAKPAKPLPKLAPGDKSGPMLADLAAGKVVVALFYNPHGSDDNAALRAVRAANRHHGRVIVHSIPIGDVGDYDAITTGVQVLQAPTIVVMGPNDKARTIVGYTEVKEVDQTVGDLGGKAFAAKAAKHLTGFAAKASYVCDGDGFKLLTSGLPTNVATLNGFLARSERVAQRSGHKLAALPASGAKQVAARRAVVAAYGEFATEFGQARQGLKSDAPGPAVLTMASQLDATAKRYQPALHAVGEHNCLG
jgi:hypothetical protein